MKSFKTILLVATAIGGLPLLSACGETADDTATIEADAGPDLGIRPDGDTEVSIDMSKINNPELTQIYDYIDQNIDSHVVNLQNWIRQPSISNTGEGIQESAEMVQGFFDQLGCQTTQVYDVGETEWGQQGNPVVYGHCDEGAEKTIAIYWMYDTMPVTQPDLWKSPPFEGALVEQAPYKKVLIGRGATNSKGPQMSMWNALMSIKAVTGKLPVNIKFIAEGDEERMDIGYRKFMADHKDLFSDVDAMYTFGGQSPGGGARGLSGSEGCVFFELITSGESWGRGPARSNIHGAYKRGVDSPAWRHIKMLSTLVDDSGNNVLVDGFYENMEPMNPADDAKLRKAADGYDMETAADNLGVARFMSDDPYTMLKQLSYGTSFNLDGIWGGNMFEGGSGAVLPNRIVSKHNIRYIPNMSGQDIVDKVRKHLDAHGYEDVQINVVGDVPWSKTSTDTEIGRAVSQMFDSFNIQSAPLHDYSSIMGGYWPSYLFSGYAVNVPIFGGMAGSGGNAHAANEYYVIEGAGKVYGMAGAEKSVATALYNYAGLNKPKTETP
ncbi:M20/M25/M40 family metallo-hydrolase [Croceicoccus mobilis]|uniref:Acetylornithine deacetylase n=1 Tax=Croceicoccus mobilis TaxID=1703339 RepID=A0A916YXN3_9SPHN|nr:M20/M25/M40 family metallo-hydrolase [Croceicoccus mobilis]GGD65894.1 acetylornithine deacetylase [Croceicoccus mobilis]